MSNSIDTDTKALNKCHILPWLEEIINNADIEVSFLNTIISIYKKYTVYIIINYEKLKVCALRSSLK